MNFSYPKGILSKYWNEYTQTKDKRFSNLLYKFFGKEWEKYIKKKFGDDNELIEFLKESNKTKQKEPQNNENSKNGKVNNRTTKRISDIKKILNIKNIRFPYKTKVLDFGAGDSTISSAMGKYFKLNMFATDKHEWINEKIKPKETNVKFKYIKEGKIPFENKFTMITSLMVLHHITDEELESTCIDIRKHLDNNGYLLLREHNCTDEYVKNLCHIEHLLYALIFDGATWEEFNKTYIGNYKSTIDWINYLNKYNLKYVYLSECTGVTNYTYILFKYIG